uniref:Uncharacterized protein n=1 Tax=Mus musculus TaxID=10090 RepID=Q8CAG9_MOUSE|nr:unnamed protein product [Mus musculus]
MPRFSTILGAGGCEGGAVGGTLSSRLRPTGCTHGTHLALKALASSQARTSSGPDSKVSGRCTGWLRSTRKLRCGCVLMWLIFFMSSSLTSSMWWISSVGRTLSAPSLDPFSASSPPSASYQRPPLPLPTLLTPKWIYLPSLFPAKIGGSLWVGLAGPQYFWPDCKE